ncbi:acyl transferase domain-containing protein/acyl carrier protein/SAM-dependent methyltransferase [Xanthomonas arboricola]|uniref:SDR family NAD(P)-dependent oxidoreductase n=1 Tax=Xanthomonas euroxanthea TaxID=2259622 RepID=UPI00142FAE76|nr:SDR family NAD(P)-dependent oxidoreductase [Xanthomonas euroxanthea]NJC37104.1 acyl transferase domain-containing protein/acyl carrier protein/SAM-dependent methyltransferase [Xanthomonas euroxanthea]
MNQQDILGALQARKITPEQAKAMLAAPARTDQTATPSSTPSSATPASERIAIVGMSGRYPGAGSLQAFWQLLAEGRSGVRDVPPSRWKVQDYYDARPQLPGKMYCRSMGALDDIEYFDPLFFGISPAEAALMDPQHRLFLQEGYRAFEDAAYAPSRLDGARCGVYLGIMGNEYVSLCQRAGAGIGEATGNSASIAAARIAYHLNLKGPAIAIDTACSSSLVATHLACQALLAGEIDLALAGGVTLYLTPESYISMCGAGMLSAAGRCSAFDNAADGFVPGEGVGALVLKRLSDAIADNDRIHAVVLGSGINQDGRTNGITAPSIRSQIDLLRDVYRRHGIDPASIGYVEAHGTGTKLGDPIEFEALTTAFREATSDTRFCALGSVKSNIGHTSAAAGVASVHKVVLALRERQLVPSLHYTQPNEHCAMELSPFVVNTELRPWQGSASTARRAAVSSFGYSGTNAHLVLEEWTDPTPPSHSGPEPVLFVVSARDVNLLRSQCRSLLRYLSLDQDIPLPDVAFTLQVGREAFEHRLAFVVDTREEAIAKLERYLSGDATDDLLLGHVTALMRDARLQDDDTQTLHYDGTSAEGLAAVAARWVQGFDPRWRDLSRPSRVRLAHLPTYPFAREYCWVGAVVDRDVAAAPGRDSPPVTDECLPQTASAPATPFAHLELLIPELHVVPSPAVAGVDAQAQVVLVGASDSEAAAFVHFWPRANRLNLPTAGGVDAWVASLRALGRIDHIVWIAADHATARPDEILVYQSQCEQVHVCFRAIKALLEHGYAAAPLEWTLITRELNATPSHAALLGLVASAVKEQENWSARLVDIGRDEAMPVGQIAAIQIDTTGRTWIHRSGKWAREHLQPVPVPSRADGAFRRNGVYLIVGGAGGVGEVFTKYLLRHYQARVVWVGRRPADGDVAAKLGNLADLGPAPLYLQADATDPVALAEVRVRVMETYGQLHGVIHSAIELHDQSVASMDAQRFEQIFATKAQVASNLFRIFGQDPLDCIVLFSSLASYSREAGQSNYSAGSLYQDALARYLANRLAPRIKTINWGFWGGIGATAALPPSVSERFAQLGVGALEPDEAMAALEIFMHAAVPQLAVLHRLWPDQRPESSPDAVPTSPEVVEMLELPNTVAAIDVEAHVKTTLLSQLAATLKLAPERIDPDGAFASYGVDSISSVRIVRALNDALRIDVAGTALFDHSSVNKLVHHILQAYDHGQLLHGADTSLPHPAAPAQTHVQEPPDGASRLQPHTAAAPGVGIAAPIAIVGMSGRFPASADLQELWAHLAAGDEVIGPITRWQVDTSQLPEHTRVCPRGGFLDDIDQFDPLFFNISGTEATYMDPQHRLLLETSWHALEDAGYAGESIAGARCGVYVGFNGGDYGQLLQDQPSLPPHAMWGNAASVLSARIAYYLDLQGPAITLDTACSSSLVAVHLACQGLWTGETDIALAGGVWIQCTPGFLISSSRAGMLSPTGQCRAFSADADGFVPSEGVAVVVLKRLQDALDAGDYIHGVIKGSGINQDGASNGITAPSAAAQERLQRQVYDTFGIDPEHLQMVEAHGTGTILGDPIEAAALTRSFRHYTQRKGFCTLGSIKTNIGHTGAAAGVAGLIKVLLAMRHRQIPPSLHFSQPNPHIAFSDSPFVVNTALQDWTVPSGQRRMAAVSSFGLSGTNAHVVVEEAENASASVAQAASAEPNLLLLSGYRAEDLPAQAKALAEHLERHAAVDIAAVGFTLAAGRRHHGHRLALIAGDAKDAARELRQWLAGATSRVMASEAAPGTAHAGISAQAQYGIGMLALETDSGKRERLLSELATLYVQGARMQLGPVFRTQRRIPLPGYRFSRKRYWVPQSSRAGSTTIEAAPATGTATTTEAPPLEPLHPFVHEVLDTAPNASFVTRWTGEEFFLRDHVVQGVPMLPGAACLEMAWAAVDLAYPGRHVRQLRNVVWLRPLVAGAPVELRVVLEPPQGADVGFRVLGADNDIPHCQGRAVLGRASPSPMIDLASIRSRCKQRQLSAGDYYDAFKLMGLSYGESYRGIERAFVGADEILAQVRVPASAEQTHPDFLMHPSLLDSALQVSIGFEIGAERAMDPVEETQPRSLMLFALDRLQVFGHCPAQVWVWIRREPGASSHKLDIDLFDAAGQILIKLQGVTSRASGAPARSDTRPATALPKPSSRGLDQAAPAPTEPGAAAAESAQAARDDLCADALRDACLVGALTLAPVWEPTLPPEASSWPGNREALAVIGGDETQRSSLKSLYPRAKYLPASIGDTAEHAADQLRSIGTLDHLLWLVPESAYRSIDGESIVNEQQRGVLAIFRLVKALVKLGYADKPLGLTIITTGSQPVLEGEANDPTHAGVHGIVGTTAKEYPRWRVRLLDLQPGAPWPLGDLLTIAADADGNAWASRHGRWYRQRWMPCAMPPPTQPAFRQNGVYVLIGGAGGIGEAFSEYLIRQYTAQVVWIGLRKRDDVIEQKISRLSALGQAPYYISADATDQVALERACIEVETQFGTIHGVVHAALLMAGDTLERMDEQRFWRGLAAKIEVSVRMAQAFAHLPLDFVLFFSSIQALEKTERQANYAAGCTVEDAYAARLAREWNCPVRVVNWGYWGSVGFAAVSSGYRNWIAQAGMGSVEPAEGMLALEKLLAGPFRQLAFVKTERPNALRGVQFSDDRLTRLEDAAPVVPLDVQIDMDPAALISEGLPPRFEALLLELMCHELEQLGAFADVQVSDHTVVAQYRPWLRHTLDVLAQHGLAAEHDGRWRRLGPSATASPWVEWERCAQQWRATPQLAAPVLLAEATLRELGQVLGGKRAATDVLFPKSSPHLVEGIYRDSPVPDFFNRVLCQVVTRYIERRRRLDPEVRLRILEIGAGTGGTTAPLIQALAPYADVIADYRFTDISKAFVVAAENDYGTQVPYMRYQTFDVERAVAPQDIGVGEFDIVIAANVLHATVDIHKTLRNAKAALKRNGVIVLNEVCATSLFAHATFGLLKGWWLYADAHLRLPGSPALSPESWCDVLAQQGFGAIALPAENARALGQQIIVAASDGWVRQPLASTMVRVEHVAAGAKPITAAVAQLAVEQVDVETDSAAASLRRLVRSTLADTLAIDVADIRDDIQLSDYGLDSMLAVQAVEVLNTQADTSLTTTSLFDYPTVDAIVAHIQRIGGTVPTSLPSSPAPTTVTASTAAPPASTDRLTQAIVQTLIEVAGIERSDIRSDAQFVDYGIDSMLAVQIVEVLNQSFEIELTSTVLFDHPTIDALVLHIGALLPGVDAAPATPATTGIGHPATDVESVSRNGLRQRLVQELCAVLDIDAGDFDAQLPFADYGLDSMLAVQWVERLNQSLQLELTTTSPFDHPTLDALLRHIMEGREEHERLVADASTTSVSRTTPGKTRPQPLSYTI